ncbi:hypothetical protein quinque_007519 [Culex quinquefasciatus]
MVRIYKVSMEPQHGVDRQTPKAIFNTANFDHQRRWPRFPQGPAANGTVTFWSRARTSIISDGGQDSLKDQRANGTVTFWSRARTSIISDRGQDSLNDQRANGTVTPWSRVRTSIISDRGQDSLEDQRANGTVTFWSRARTSIISDGGQDSLNDQRANGTATFWSRARTSIISDGGQDSRNDQRANGTVTPGLECGLQLSATVAMDSLEDHHDNSAHGSECLIRSKCGSSGGSGSSAPSLGRPAKPIIDFGQPIAPAMTLLNQKKNDDTQNPITTTSMQAVPSASTTTTVAVPSASTTTSPSVSTPAPISSTTVAPSASTTTTKQTVDTNTNDGVLDALRPGGVSEEHIDKADTDAMDAEISELDRQTLLKRTKSSSPVSSEGDAGKLGGKGKGG